MKFLSKKPGLIIFLLGGIVGVLVFAILLFTTLYSTDWGERSSRLEPILKPFFYLFWLPLQAQEWFDRWLRILACTAHISEVRGGLLRFFFLQQPLSTVV